jgi:hypothetical protein
VIVLEELSIGRGGVQFSCERGQRERAQKKKKTYNISGNISQRGIL